MTTNMISDLKARLRRLLSNFNIPEDKKEDVDWLSQNLTIKNTGHRDLPEALELINEIRGRLKEERKKLIKYSHKP